MNPGSKVRSSFVVAVAMVFLAACTSESTTPTTTPHSTEVATCEAVALVPPWNSYAAACETASDYQVRNTSALNVLVLEAPSFGATGVLTLSGTRASEEDLARYAWDLTVPDVATLTPAYSGYQAVYFPPGSTVSVTKQASGQAFFLRSAPKATVAYISALAITRQINAVLDINIRGRAVEGRARACAAAAGEEAAGNAHPQQTREQFETLLARSQDLQPCATLFNELRKEAQYAKQPPTLGETMKKSTQSMTQSFLPDLWKLISAANPRG